MGATLKAGIVTQTAKVCSQWRKFERVHGAKNHNRAPFWGGAPQGVVPLRFIPLAESPR